MAQAFRRSFLDEAVAPDGTVTQVARPASESALPPLPGAGAGAGPGAPASGSRLVWTTLPSLVDAVAGPGPGPAPRPTLRARAA
eukprot:tig00021038_g17548.t1